MTHSITQKLVYYHHINQCINNPHLSLYIRQLKNGRDVGTIEYLSRVPAFEGDQPYKQLLCYYYLTKDKHPLIKNVLKDVDVDFDEETWISLKEKVNETLEQLNLPTDEDG